MTQYWLITKKSDGSTVETSFATKDANTHPKDAGFAWDAALHVATPLPGPFDPARQVRQGLGYVDDLTKIKDNLVTMVKLEAERRKMMALSSGGAKKQEYAGKEREVALYNSLGGTAAAILTALNLLSPSQRLAMFPMASAAATLRGETTIAAAITRFAGGITRSSTFHQLCAQEEKACEAINAATTLTAAKAVATGLGWGLTV